MIILKQKRKFLFSLFLANSTLAFSGTMGGAQDLTNGFFVTGAPIYGSLSDEGINKTLFADTFSANGDIEGHQISLDSRWGFLLGVGYKFNPDNDITLTYTNLKSKGFSDIDNTGPNGVLSNRLSQIVQNETNFIVNNPVTDIAFNGQQMIDASASVSSHYDFQTVELLTHHYFQNSFLNHVRFSRFYGIKATEFKKGFSAEYAGSWALFDVDVFPPTTVLVPLEDEIDYAAKYFGIGPQIGMGATWSLNRYISIVGDVSAAVLGGSYSSSWDEDLNTSRAIPNIPVTQNNGHYGYDQSTPTTLWTSIVVGSNLAVAAQIPFSNGSSFGVQGGINTEQYWSQVNADSIRSSISKNNVYFAQRFAVRDVFIKLSYTC